MLSSYTLPETSPKCHSQQARDWFEEASEFETALCRVGREAEVAATLILSLEDDIAEALGETRYRRLLGALDALERIAVLTDPTAHAPDMDKGHGR